MLDVALWYVTVQIVGLAALPVAFRLLRSLPDQGYAFARPMGLLIIAYVLWLGASFGVVDNRPITAVLIVVGLGAAAWTLLRREVAELADFWRGRRALVLGVEGLFLTAYLGWCLVRAHVPEILGTEKPMEFAFLNAILRSERFPPADPWLSGYSISYYYFGYVMAALLAQLSGVASGVAFNLTIATLFALTVIGAFSLGYNLVAGLRRRWGEEAAGVPTSTLCLPPWVVGALATLFVVFLANWEGALEALHARGFGSQAFWRRVGIKDLNHPYVSAAWHPTDQQDNWWWFRAARVIADYGADGKARDYTINEFPFFSFLLGDMHPHVLALPFTLLALAFALGVLRSPPGDWSWLRRRPQAPASLAWLQRSRVFGFALAHLALYPAEALRRWPVEGLATALVFGGLGFLNAWDMPTYLFVLVGAFGLKRYLARPSFDATWRREVFEFGWLALLGSVVLYLPFYVGFRSQTSGLGVVGYRSQLHHFVIFWGPLLFVVGSFLAAQIRRTAVPERPGLVVVPPESDWTRLPGIWPAVGSATLVLLAMQLPPLSPWVPFWLQAPALVVILPLLAASLALISRHLRRTSAPVGGEATTGARARSQAGAPVRDRRGERRGGSGSGEVAGGAAPGSPAPEHAFALFLSFAALLLVFGTEFVFIRDLFGNRMNTVFKLYYQAWTMLAVVAAYGIYYLASVWPKRGSPRGLRLGASAWLIVGAAAVAGGLVYAPASLLSRLANTTGPATLDGSAYLARSSPADYAAIQWLQRNVTGNPVIVEASGGSYSQYGRVSVNTGLPTIVGWDFHEMQWRGSYDEQRRRQADLDRIYGSLDGASAATLLRQYDAEYVYVGPLEVERYGRTDRAGLEKFAGFMDVVYETDGVTIYRMKGQR